MTHDLRALYSFRRKARALLNGILILMAAAGVANTMLMAIYERTREIGTMMALGLRRAAIVRLFALEAAFIGLLGSLVGCVLGGGVTFYLERRGIDISRFGFNPAEMKNIPIRSTIYPDLSGDMLAGAFALGIVVAVLAALYPAVRGARLEPVEALRS